jgi:hypothetical protein
MRSTFPFILLLAMAAMPFRPPTPPAPTTASSPNMMVSAITLEPQVFAIETGPDGGADTSYTVYYGDGALVYSPEGEPLVDLSFDEVYAQAQQAGLVR